MEVGILFKIGAVGILVSVLCQVLKHSGREEQAFLASLAGLVLVKQHHQQRREDCRTNGRELPVMQTGPDIVSTSC